MKKIYTCKLAEFVQKYPVYKHAFCNLLADPEYIVKFTLTKDNKLSCFELGYKEDYFAIDHRP